MSVATFIGVATSTFYVSSFPGNPIPVQMPSGIQDGDELVVFIENYQINPVSISGPSGWLGTLSTGFFTKTADGSEDGAIINWTTQNTAGAFTHPPRVMVVAALCYRFLMPPISISRFFKDSNALAGTASLTDIPGTGGSAGYVSNPQLRVYCAFGDRADAPADKDAIHPITGVTWTNPTDRTGLVALEWAGEGNLNDGTGMSVADIEYEFSSPFAPYNPHDAVTVFGGSYSTAFTLYTAVYNLPLLLEEPYWGVLGELL